MCAWLTYLWLRNWPTFFVLFYCITCVYNAMRRCLPGVYISTFLHIFTCFVFLVCKLPIMQSLGMIKSRAYKQVYVTMAKKIRYVNFWNGPSPDLKPNKKKLGQDLKCSKDEQMSLSWSSSASELKFPPGYRNWPLQKAFGLQILLLGGVQPATERKEGNRNFTTYYSP